MIENHARHVFPHSEARQLTIGTAADRAAAWTLPMAAAVSPGDALLVRKAAE
jgi:hypothetical protein